MEKKKILKMGAIIVGVAVFLFLLVQIKEALDNRQMRLGIEKDRKERQEKKEAKEIAEKYMDSFTQNLEFYLSSSMIKDVKVSYKPMNYNEFIEAFGSQDTKPDYAFFYRVYYSSDSIDQTYTEAKESDSIPTFCDNLKEMTETKKSIFSEYEFEHEEWMDNKSIRIYYVDDAKEYEFPISGTSGAIYRCYDYDWENTRHLDIDDNTVYSEVKDLRKDSPNTEKGNISQGSASGSNSGSHGWHRSDPYDVENYDDPDDFAEEWAEEFGDGSYDAGYDDAYDYWESERD